MAWIAEPARIVAASALSAVAYAWVLYPVIIMFLGRRAPANRTMPTVPPPTISVIVTVHNEEARVRRRLDNLLTLDHPRKSLEIIVASDGSTDTTVAIARTFEPRGVRVMEFQPNRGKAVAQDEAIRRSVGELVVLTDAGTLFELDIMSAFVRAFADPRVACVSANLDFVTTPSSRVATSEGLYFRYESALRRSAGRRGILLNVAGAAMAFRRSSYVAPRPGEDADDLIGLSALLDGDRVVLAEDARATDEPSENHRQQFRARARITAISASTTWRIVRERPTAFLRRPIVIWLVLSQRLLRWLTAPLLGVAFIASAVGAGQGDRELLALLLMQLGVYLSAALGRDFPVASTFASFLVGVAGQFAGLLRFLAGRTPARWTRT